MMTRICKQFTFDAAHHLDRLPEGHKCRRVHGHTYKVDVEVHGTPDKNGFIVDYAELDAMWQPLHDKLDHRMLNDITGLEIPTTEHLAAWIYERMCEAILAVPTPRPVVEAIRVYESSSTWCEVRREPAAPKNARRADARAVLDDAGHFPGCYAGVGGCLMTDCAGARMMLRWHDTDASLSRHEAVLLEAADTLANESSQELATTLLAAFMDGDRVADADGVVQLLFDGKPAQAAALFRGARRIVTGGSK